MMMMMMTTTMAQIKMLSFVGMNRQRIICPMHPTPRSISMSFPKGTIILAKNGFAEGFFIVQNHIANPE
jgi:hypothetical protein